MVDIIYGKCYYSNCSFSMSSSRRTTRTSTGKLERIAKSIVKQDLKNTDQLFFIDQEVYDLYFPEIKENVKDSSLSNFMARYDLSMQIPELIEFFDPHSSRMRNFAHLKHMSGKYGYHLCYMALREAANEDNHNKELTAKMKAKAISLKKKPPPCYYDIPYSMDDRQQPLEEDNNEIDQQMEGLKLEDSVSEDEPNDDKPPSSEVDAPNPNIDVLRKISGVHMMNCNCQTCIRARSALNPYPKPHNHNTPPSAYTRSKSEYHLHEKSDVDKPLTFDAPRKFSTPQQVSSIEKNTSTGVPGDSVNGSKPGDSANYLSSVKRPDDIHGDSKVVSGRINTAPKELRID